MEPSGNQQPGQTIAPTNTKPDRPPTAPSTQPPSPETKPAPKPEASGPSMVTDPQTGDPEAIAWTASEFIAHAKSFGWYATLAAGTLAFAALIFLITRDFISPSVIIVGALFLGFYGGRQPRQLEYRVDTNGLSIGRKHFSYNEFRSFSVLPEGAFSSIVFMPLKRFAVPTTIYYAPEDEHKITSLLSSYLPFEERGHDAVDRLMHRIRY